MQTTHPSLRISLQVGCATLLAVVGLHSSQAQPTQTATYQATLPMTATRWTNSISVPQFNPALGALKEVHLEWSGSISNYVRIESLDMGAAQVVSGSGADIDLFPSFPDGSVLALAQAHPQKLQTNDFTAYDGVLDYLGTSGDTYTNELTLAADPVIYLGVDTLPFVGLGQVTLWGSAAALNFASGTGNLATSFRTRAGATLLVRYIYERPQAAPPVCALDPDSAGVCAGQTATFTVSVIGGKAPFTYAWTGPNGFTSADASITVGVAGDYVVIVTDALGQTTDCNAALGVNPALFCSITPATPGLCAGDSQTLTVTPVGGTAPYSVVWNTGDTAASITVSAAGPYTATVTDAAGCTTVCQAVVTVNQPPTLTVTPAESTICYGESATLTADATGGTAPYAFKWSTGETTPTLVVTNAGTYTVTVTDAAGCSSGGSASVAVTFGSITGTVLRDCDADGKLANEIGLGGVTVTLKGTNGAFIASTTTDPSGTYTFPSLLTGGYVIVVTPPANYTLTTCISTNTWKDTSGNTCWRDKDGRPHWKDTNSCHHWVDSTGCHRWEDKKGDHYCVKTTGKVCLEDTDGKDLDKDCSRAGGSWRDSSGNYRWKDSYGNDCWKDRAGTIYRKDCYGNTAWKDAKGNCNWVDAEGKSRWKDTDGNCYVKTSTGKNNLVCASGKTLTKTDCKSNNSYRDSSGRLCWKDKKGNQCWEEKDGTIGSRDCHGNVSWKDKSGNCHWRDNDNKHCWKDGDGKKHCDDGTGSDDDDSGDCTQVKNVCDKTVILGACEAKADVNFGLTGTAPAVSITVTGPLSAKCGDTITYQIAVTNLGNTCLYGGLSVVAPLLGGEVFHATPVAPGEGFLITSNYTIKASDPIVLVNTVTAVGYPPTGATVSLQNTWTVQVTPCPPPCKPLVCGDTATIGYWQNCNGQALIKSLNGGYYSKNLGNWLATTFPYLWGANAGANNLTGKSNWEVASFYVSKFSVNGPKTEAQMLAAALALYVTDSDLAGTSARCYGFNVSTTGTGSKCYTSGGTSKTVLEWLQQANGAKQAGTFNSTTYNTIFDGINNTGDIP